MAPAAIALLTLWLVVPGADAIAGGLFSRLRELVKDQPVPALIVLFTIFEMMLYAARHRLPLAQLCGFAGPPELPAHMRGDFEQAGRLLEDIRRLMVRKRRAIQREVTASNREEIEKALEQLRAIMQNEPFSPEAFVNAHNRVSSLVTRHLEQWQRSDFLEYVESIGVAIAVALLLRAFVVEAFKIPSGSMLPTLQLQDHIFVNKLAYGPTIPFTKTRLWNGLPPLRGDIMVFEYPDPDPILVKTTSRELLPCPAIRWSWTQATQSSMAGGCPPAVPARTISKRAKASRGAANSMSSSWGSTRISPSTKKATLRLNRVRTTSHRAKSGCSAITETTARIHVPGTITWGLARLSRTSKVAPYSFG